MRQRIQVVSLSATDFFWKMFYKMDTVAHAMFIVPALERQGQDLSEFQGSRRQRAAVSKM